MERAVTGPEHYRAAENLIASADEWLDADWGWKANMSTDERLARRASDLAAAQAHATLALAVATARPDPEWWDITPASPTGRMGTGTVNDDDEESLAFADESGEAD